MSVFQATAAVYALEVGVVLCKANLNKWQTQLCWVTLSSVEHCQIMLK